MITIDKAYFSGSSQYVTLILRNSDPSESTWNELSKISITNIITGVEYSGFTWEISSYSSPILILDLDIHNYGLLFEDSIRMMSEDYFYIVHEDATESIEGPNGIGITKITIEAATTEDAAYIANLNEFYEYKARMLTQKVDNQNLIKLNKKIMSFSFLEQMLIQSLSLNYEDDALLYYREMCKLYISGYSNIIQNNPNCEY